MKKVRFVHNSQKAVKPQNNGEERKYLYRFWQIINSDLADCQKSYGKCAENDQS